ncbi:MAG: restriction endonuclease subunit S [Porphyromonas sp.]|uniref:restriction endonuclease subunit S n=1 Tax=Porphyromonas sp. TaxID=1924944 RepID=UPI002A74B8E8|nr:restriction endonuclease subunit S [Porphyromonas sp.]MDY3112309.1 restriction endonuclease subunit S [Porphyromonas sp.]
MSNYKVITKGQFVYIPDTSRRGDKISIALMQEEEAIVSQAYTVFEVIDKSELLPDYLMMWFRRPEFDRYARFKSHGSAREILDWEEMCEVRLPIPDIEKQREIVAQYEAITRRIALNERICANLEETAQALYNKMFVQDIDPDNLPDGWTMGVFEDFASVSGGKACTIDKSATKTEEYRYPIAGATGVIGYSSDYNSKGKSLTIGRVGSLGVVNRYDGPVYMADNVLVITSKHYHFCEQILKSINYEEIKEGGVQGLITQKELKKVEVLLPERNEIENYEASVRPLYERIDLIERQNTLLTTLLSILVLSIS